MAKKVTRKNLATVWLNLSGYVAEILRDAPGAVEVFCPDLDALLDKIAADDGFGTEGQNDPRGDQRG